MRRVLLVASTGGHLAELHHLRSEVCDVADDVRWATFSSEQSRSLLAGERVSTLRTVRPRAYLALLRLLPKAVRILWTQRPDRIVSTGSGVALAFLPLAPLVGAEAIYVESAARISGPSLTGRLLSALPWVRTYTQYAANVSPRWWYRWSIFDRWHSMPPPRPLAAGHPPRILVTLGTMEFAFSRLVDAVLAAAPPDATFVWQLGETPAPFELPGRSFSFLENAELERYARSCTIMISHAGVGSALMALTAGVRPVLVPRLRTLGEHVDDHQVQVARDLESRGLATCLDADELAPGIFALDHRVYPLPGNAAESDAAAEAGWVSLPPG